MKYVYIRLITAAALFICFITALLTLQDHVIFYQEQHTLFLFTRDYMARTIASRGITGWIGDFVVQFYHIPWLGAAITSGILTAVYLLTGSIIRRLTGRRDLLQLGAAAAVALYFTLDSTEENPGIATTVALGLLALWILTLAASRLLPKRTPDAPLGKFRTAIPLVLATAYIIAGYYLQIRDYNRPERAMIRAERAIKQHDWDGAIAITGQYLSTGRTNKLMLYLRSIALAQKGELVAHLFDFPQKAGQQALAFPWTSNSREAEYGHWVHEVTGDINAAHHWAFEALTCWGETAPHLLDLTRYNIALGRPDVARKFARTLSHSLFYRGEARRLTEQIDRGEPGDLRYAFADTCATGVKWVNVLDFRPNLMQNYKADPGNPVTRQYLIASILLSGELPTLCDIIGKDDLRDRNVSEAMLLYSLDPRSTPLDSLGLEVTPEIGQRFSRFTTAMRQSSPAAMQAEFGDSFLYYYHYLIKR